MIGEGSGEVAQGAIDAQVKRNWQIGRRQEEPQGVTCSTG